MQKVCANKAHKLVEKQRHTSDYINKINTLMKHLFKERALLAQKVAFIFF